MEPRDIFQIGLLLLAVCVVPALVFVGTSYGRDRAMAWKIIAAGMTAPWIVGATVKLYLQSLNRPTLPWSYFLNGQTLLFMIPMSVWFSIPFFVLAVLHGRVIAARPFMKIESYRGRFWLTMCVCAGGVIGVCHSFVSVFWVFDPLYILLPLWAAYLPDMLIGFVVGVAVGRRVDRRRAELPSHR
ncbi:MAG: hypothetical protein HKN20_05075 [Gemmatimonadetes bacterium]|nr:hypothetical protein [Gemmatimonadota bacterium]